MGVTGLWRLVEPAGKPVPVETLENKVLAVDISIWLHQVVKGYQDAKGAPLPNAHLIGLFQRLCKLLYFRIKPIFVFDGAFPELKKETIAKRQDSKNRYHSESERLKRELAILLSKKTAIGSLLGKQISPNKKPNPVNKDQDDMFKLPALPQNKESESESSDDEDTSSGSIVDLHSVDLQSDSFKNLPTKEKYDLLIELKETRKMNSWGKLHTLPKKSDNFSDFQMQRLLKRRKVQECIEETEKEMGDVGMSMNELESLLNEEGIDTKIESLPTRRIASNNNTRYLLINNVREALAKAKEKKEAGNKPQTSTDKSLPTGKPSKHDELEDDLQKAIQMSLECSDEPNTSGCQSKTDDSWTSVLTDTDYSDMSDSEDELEQPDMSTAKAYIMQYSDYTHKAIEKIVTHRSKSGKTKSKAPEVNQILKEINSEKSIIADNVELSSSDEESRPEIIHSDADISVADKKTIEVEKQIEDTQDETDEYVESTQASVMLIENTEPDVISLDSDVGEPIEEKQTMNETDISFIVSDLESSGVGELGEVPELLKETVNIMKESINAKDLESNDTDDEFEKVPEVMKESVNAKDLESSDTDDEFEEMPGVIKETVNTMKESVNGKDQESSDTDDEFEEVPEVEDKSRKPVVELTLNVDDIPNDEDDIFADVFSPIINSNRIKENIAKPVSNTFENIGPKKEPTDNTNKIQHRLISDGTALQNKEMEYVKYEKQDLSTDDDDELLKAIQMSLECVQEPNTNTKVIKESSASAQPHKQKGNDVSMAENPDFKEHLIKDHVCTENEKSVSNPVSETITVESDSVMQPEKHEDDSVVNIESISKDDTMATNDKESNKDLVNKPQPKEPLTAEQLNSMVEVIRSEEQDLIQEKGRLDRIGRNITEQMTKEAQELLQIFGIPYIVAPMEAEAQCAFLESVKLTDGTITDDSDIWLFGGQTVYKNFFNQKKHVLQYVSERIEKSFNLNREQLILLALLVGSDYTTGVAGVGPVTAMEILASFPFNKKQVLAETSKQVRYAKLLDGLKEFKLWVKAEKRTDNTSLKKKLRNVTLSEDFPSIRVVQAYMEPNVEKSEDKFTWGELDITVLRDYAKSKFGWSQQKFDEIIKPVLARMKDRKNQKTVHDYFKRRIEFQTLEDQMSKRVKAAVLKMGPEGQTAEANLTEGETVKTTKKRKKCARTSTDNEAGPSKPKQKKKQVEDSKPVVKVVEVKDGKTGIEINVPKTDRYQEIIPQREKDKQHLLENKMKAIEIFRKTTIDRKQKPKKRKPILPKDKADLSESSSSD
ncbi:DNA excision repair protein ERCC-5 [Cydia pomonella]|uniref:DNA excision repair protein ERCC-5 n=1 Tax=Cydia pomonella TaxID=82600 RepID=UPI002ADE012D|nr:DNA excision repair protein ERCC-5 [Cydia pomonella]